MDSKRIAEALASYEMDEPHADSPSWPGSDFYPAIEYDEIIMHYDWFAFRLGARTRQQLYGINSNYATGWTTDDVDWY